LDISFIFCIFKGGWVAEYIHNDRERADNQRRWVKPLYALLGKTKAGVLYWGFGGNGMS
jgi:hypothetical protein